MRTLLVGLDNPRSSNPGHALYPVPKNATGRRIVELIRLADPDFTARQYLRDFVRTNLYPTRAAPLGRGIRAADRDAFALLAHMIGAVGIMEVVLFGKRTVDAFAAYVEVTEGKRREIDWTFSATIRIADADVVFFALPHPSGRNYWYNNERNRRRAGDLLAALRPF